MTPPVTLPATIRAVRWLRSGTKLQTSWHVPVGGVDTADRTLCHTRIPPTGARSDGVTLPTLRLSGCEKCYKILLAQGTRDGRATRTP